MNDSVGFWPEGRPGTAEKTTQVFRNPAAPRDSLQKKSDHYRKSPEKASSDVAATGADAQGADAGKNRMASRTAKLAATASTV